MLSGSTLSLGRHRFRYRRFLYANDGSKPRERSLMPKEGNKPPSSEALALLYLRSRRDWSQKERALRQGLADPEQISRYETGGKPLSRRKLDSFAATLDFSPEAADAVLFIDRLIEPEAPEEPFSPVALTAGERRSLDRAILTAGWSILDRLQESMRRTSRTEKAEKARRRAQALWKRLKAVTRQERRDRVAVSPRFQC